MVNKPIPTNLQRVLLVNPTKYLGNLLLAGGLMQAFSRHCQAQDIQCRFVLDDSFRELCGPCFPADAIIWFPRRAIGQAGLTGKLSLYVNCLKQIRAFRADLAFNIEEDSATSHLTRLSGAGFKLGCSPLKHQRGYDHVLPLAFENRDPAKAHRWRSFLDVFTALGMEEPEPGYLDFGKLTVPEALSGKLHAAGWHNFKTTIALHAGATKDYKKWPLEHMAALIGKIRDAGMQPVLLGAGESDQQANQAILDLLPDSRKVINLCNLLSLLELAQCLGQCSAMIGNDSGPFHLGSALGVPGLVLWGPTNKAIWGPLGKQSSLIQGPADCDPACNKGYCLHDHRCLKELTPDLVSGRLQELLLQYPPQQPNLAGA